jgi:hypothetical protein
MRMPGKTAKTSYISESHVKIIYTTWQGISNGTFFAMKMVVSSLIFYFLYR